LGILNLHLDQVVYTVFDFETTGMSYNFGDRIVEAAFVKFSLSDGIIDEFTTLINPGIEIPYDVSMVHGIFDEDVTDAPYFSSFVHNILNFIDNTILVGHNVYFDLAFLKGEMSSFGIEVKSPYLCTMGFPGFYGAKTRQKLGNICTNNGICLMDAHTALADTKATAELLKVHILSAKKKGLHTFMDLKETKKSYKFISSWNDGLYSYKKISKEYIKGSPYFR
jgi:DNA polymerase III epsilon subunit family exonuclease